MTNPTKRFHQTIDLQGNIQPLNPQNQFEYDGQFLRITAVKAIPGTWDVSGSSLSKSELKERRLNAQKR
jgi:hypothetical protein